MLNLFFGLILLVLWLLAEAACIWYILKERRPPICYGYGVGQGGSNRAGTTDAPNFYRRR